MLRQLLVSHFTGKPEAANWIWSGSRIEPLLCGKRDRHVTLVMLALRALFLHELMRSLVYRGIGEISTHQQEKFCNEAELRM